MEYSTDGGESWVAYDSTNIPTFAGDQKVLVRFAADEATGTPASEAASLTFTKNVPAAVSASVIKIVNADNPSDEDAPDVITLIADGNIETTNWKTSNLMAGDSIEITIGDETLTYVLQQGDIEKLTGTEDIMITVGTTTDGVTYSNDASNATAQSFDLALTDTSSVVVKLIDQKGNEVNVPDVIVTTD